MGLQLHAGSKSIESMRVSVLSAGQLNEIRLMLVAGRIMSHVIDGDHVLCQLVAIDGGLKKQKLTKLKQYL